MEITLLPKDAGLCLIHRRDARSRRKTQKAFVRTQKSLSFHVPDLRTGAQPYGMERATATFAGLSSSRACEY